LTTVFCPYRGYDIDEKDASLEHVVPTSLGGTSTFSVVVERAANSELGSEVDGPIVTELYAHRRITHDLRGHSGEAPRLTSKVSIEDLGDHPARWEQSQGGNKIRLIPRVTRERRPDGSTVVSVTGDSDDAQRIFAEIRAAAVLKGLKVEAETAQQVTVEKPRITGRKDFDLVAIGRFFVKVAIGTCHWLWGEQWSRSEGAAGLRTALWSRSAADLNSAVQDFAQMTPADCWLRIGEHEHSFLVVPMPDGKLALAMSFFGQIGHVLRFACPLSVVARANVGAVIVNVTDKTTEFLSLEELIREGRAIRPPR
jgi:hypothetical protein